MTKYIALITIVLVLLMFISVSEQALIPAEIDAVESNSSGSDPDVELTALRGEIDTINQEILKLLNKRAEVVLEIGKLKRENSMQVYDPEREKEIEKSLVEINTGPMPDESVIKIFREIISASRELQ